MKRSMPNYPANLQGKSEHYRYTVCKILQTTVDTDAFFDIRCQRYSIKDGGILEDSYIFTDHKNRPFKSLSQIAHFIEKDAMGYWYEKISLEKNDVGVSVEKYQAWSMLHKNIEKFLKINGEPIPLRTNCN